MSVVRVPVSLEQLPRALKRYGHEVPFATSRALNQIAYGLQEELRRQADRELDLKNNHARKSIQYDKGSKRNPDVVIYSDAWYMERQVEGETRRPRIGIRHKGKRYLFVPSRRTKRGMLPKALRFTDKTFIFRTKTGHLLAAVRTGKRRGTIRVLGVLTPEAEYQERIDWQQASKDYVERHFQREFKRAMIKGAREFNARYGYV